VERAQRGRRDEGPREALSLGALPWVNTALGTKLANLVMI